MALIVPRFRRESWYGRLYLRAYGADRGWLVRLKRMTGTTGFGYAPYPTLTADMPEAEQLMTLLNWRSGREEARERAIAFLMAPPPVQPFVEDGAKVSICPTFWKIVLALFVYCPIAAIRAVGHAIATTLRAVGLAIADAFRWVGRRYGRPIEYTAFSVLALFAYGAVVYSTAFISYRLTGEIMGRQGMSRNEYAVRELEAETAARRERLRQDYVERCVAAMRPPAGQYVLDPWELEERQSSFRMTTQRELERCERDFSYESRSPSHEESAQQRSPTSELFTAMIDRVAHGDFDCATDGWSLREPGVLFKTEDDWKAFAAWLAGKLRERFAGELAAEAAAREQRIAEARKEDAKIVGAMTAVLLPVRQDPHQLYERFKQDCRYDEYHKRWGARWRSPSNATCVTLAGLFADQIADAQSALRWQERRAALRQYGPGVGKWLGLVVGAVFLLALLIVLLDRYLRAIGRALGWFWDAVLLPAMVWTCIIVFAPIWVPARFLAYPALKLVGRAWMLVWNSGPVARARAAIDAALTAAGNAITRFFAAIGQILTDTWHLIRAFASAKWERLCPFIEWTP